MEGRRWLHIASVAGIAVPILLAVMGVVGASVFISEAQLGAAEVAELHTVLNYFIIGMSSISVVSLAAFILTIKRPKREPIATYRRQGVNDN